jgi:hypothetical protein
MVAAARTVYPVPMATNPYQGSAAALEETAEAGPMVTEDLGDPDLAGLDMAIADIELQERAGFPVSPAADLPDLTESELQNNAGDESAQSSDLQSFLHDIAKRRGLTDAAEVTPDYLASVVEDGRVAEKARRERKGIQTMTRDEFNTQLEEAYAAIDAYVASK